MPVTRILMSAEKQQLITFFISEAVCEIMLHCSSYPSSIPMAFRGPRPPTSPCV
ncbi:hypothetical protein ACMD2_22465, partial [Ananas comosus]